MDSDICKILSKPGTPCCFFSFFLYSFSVPYMCFSSRLLSYYWPGWCEDAAAWVKICDHCRLQDFGGGLISPAKSLKVEGPNQRWQIDLKVYCKITWINKEGRIQTGTVHYFNCIDCFSKKLWSRIVLDKTADAQEKAMLEVLGESGVRPGAIQLDCGGYDININTN